MLHDLHFVLTKKDFEWILEKAKELDESISGFIRIIQIYLHFFCNNFNPFTENIIFNQ